MLRALKPLQNKRIIPFMVKKNIINTIKKHNLINANEHIVIGLSGGPDSVCLFSVLNELKDDLGITLHAVHVNHGFRPGAADEDQKYVETLCAECGVESSSFLYDCNAIAEEHGLSSEEAGRKVRYESFLKIAAELMQKGIPEEKIKIAVAHNADDQAETVLFRLLRGTGTDGLAGMAYSRMEKNICVIRPLLDTWRKDIEAYCDAQGLNPRTDHTNLQPIYTRNKIRLDLIPYLQENFNANIMETLGRLSRIAAEDKEYLWECVENSYAELEKEPGVLDQQGLVQLAPAVRHRVIMKALQQVGLTQDVTAVHLEAADSILQQTGESKVVEFPNNYKMAVRYDEVVFYCDEAVCNGTYHWNISIEDLMIVNFENALSNDKKLSPRAGNAITGDNCSKQSMPGMQVARFDYDKVTGFHGAAQPELRTRREGDFLSIIGGRKKIQNLFVDMKVPKEHRDNVMVVAIGSEILWLPVQPEKGVKRARYSHRCKLDMNTKKCLKLEYDCEI